MASRLVSLFTVTRLSSLIVVGILVLALLCTPSALGQGAETEQVRMSPVVKAVQRTAPAVVNISGRKPANQPRQLVDGSENEVNGMGTGLIIDSRGYILTNHHVITGIDRIQVRLSRSADIAIKDYAAQIIAVDSPTDLAVIKIEADVPLPVIPLATSSDLMLGETVIAIGNAYGYEDTITKGIISCLQRQVQVTEEQVYQDLIQTDASINPGNSGGPLINIRGEAIGINVAVRVGAQAIGFAIPMDRAMEVVNRILRDAVERRLVAGIDVTTKVENRVTYVSVTGIEAGSLADTAGIKTDDRIVNYGDQPLNWACELYINLLENGFSSTSLIVQRGDVDHTLTFGPDTEIAEETLSSNRAWNELGIRVSPVSFRNLPGKNKYTGGLKVLQVRNSGPANQRFAKSCESIRYLFRISSLPLPRKTSGIRETSTSWLNLAMNPFSSKESS